MKRAWEYTTVRVTPPETVVDLLKQLGKAGWEAWHLSATGQTIYLKRELEAS